MEVSNVVATSEAQYSLAKIVHILNSIVDDISVAKKFSDPKHNTTGSFIFAIHLIAVHYFYFYLCCLKCQS